MAYDIGPRIGIDGEREFRQQLQSVSTQLKTLGSEMKVVTTAFAGNEDSMEALTAKNEVLTKTIDSLNDKISKQRRFLDLAKEKFGDSADETQKWERALNESQAQLNTLQNELRQNERRLESFGDEAKEAGDAMDEAGRSALDFGDALKASFVGNLAAEGAKALFGALVELGGAMVNLDEETKEYRQQQGLLKASFKSNKLDANDARKAYEGLYRVIGESGRATEAAQLLGNLAKSSEDIDFWVQMAAGSWAKFGEALPINNLIEAANEAVKTGESVSALDDAINWSGGNAELFKEELAACATEEERLALITDTLNGYLGDSAGAFYENNEQILKERDAALKAEEALGILGETVARIKTEIGEEFGEDFVALAQAFSDLAAGAEEADVRFEAAIESILSKLQAKGGDFAKIGMEVIFSVLEGMLSDPEKISDTTFEIINAILQGLADHAPELAAQGTLLATHLAIGMIENFIDWHMVQTELFKGWFDAIEDKKPEFEDAGRRLIQAVVGEFAQGVEQLKEMWENLMDFFSRVGDVFKFGAKYAYTGYSGLKPSQQATGLNYVPYDGFLASLHEGEMILTRKQAEMVRANGITNTGMQSMTESVINAMSAIGSYENNPIIIVLQTPDGDEFARWQLPSLIRVAEANGTPITAQ